MSPWVERFAWASLGVLAMTAGALTGAVPLIGVGGTLVGAALVKRPGDAPPPNRKR